MSSVFKEKVLLAARNAHADQGLRTFVTCVVSVGDRVASWLAPALRSRTSRVAINEDGLIMESVILNISHSAVQHFKVEEGVMSGRCRVGGTEAFFEVPVEAIISVSSPDGERQSVMFHLNWESLAAGTYLEKEGSSPEKEEPKKPTLTVVK